MAHINSYPLQKGWLHAYIITPGAPSAPMTHTQKNKILNWLAPSLSKSQPFGISSNGALSNGLLNVFDASYYCALHLRPVDAFVQRFVN